MLAGWGPCTASGHRCKHLLFLLRTVCGLAERGVGLGPHPSSQPPSLRFCGRAHRYHSLPLGSTGNNCTDLCYTRQLGVTDRGFIRLFWEAEKLIQLQLTQQESTFVAPDLCVCVCVCVWERENYMFVMPSIFHDLVRSHVFTGGHNNKTPRGTPGKEGAPLLRNQRGDNYHHRGQLCF